MLVLWFQIMAQRNQSTFKARFIYPCHGSFAIIEKIRKNVMRFVLEFDSLRWNMKMGTKTLLAYCASIHKCPYLSLIHKIDMNIDLGKIANFYNTILVRGLKLLLRDSIWQ